MVDRHYFLNLKPWSARTLYVYAHALFSTKILRWSAGNFCLQVVLPERKFFFPALYSCPVHAMQVFNDYCIIQTFRDVMSLTYLVKVEVKSVM
jgi:hypothetical protein